MESRETWRVVELTSRQGKCRHAVTGNAPAGKLCAYSYECARCPYDQMLEDLDQVAIIGPEAVRAALAA
jgi:hypothetical protein